MPGRQSAPNVTGKGAPQVETNLILQQTFLEIVENQLRDGDPPETSRTLKRLVAEGHSRREAKKLIGAVVVMELNEVIKLQEPFSRTRFVQGLNLLPELPFDYYGIPC